MAKKTIATITQNEKITKNKMMAKKTKTKKPQIARWS